ncbi:protein-L-isoaspartate O-methyltransferase [Streptomyces sp. NPDC058621]|uniref:protein-L-isoaspartate O-methyltransferase family protein n=1 Tax=Streptomyces sp. NPDC058621 TaxID=3346561 RepID=UPI00364CF6A2
MPRWWDRTGREEFELRAPANHDEWFADGYRDASLLTKVGTLHADHAKPGDEPKGRPTCSATLPSLLLKLYRMADIGDGDQVLDVGTGSGYGTALLARRLSDEQVVSVDVDPYLVEAALARLAETGLRPRVEAVDATGDLPCAPGSFDRVIATVAVRTIPQSWLAALRVGGRLVTTIAGTSLLITATKNADGGASGFVSWDRAGFMVARHGDDYPPRRPKEAIAAQIQGDAAKCVYPLPVVDVESAWDLQSMLDLSLPGIEHAYWEDSGGLRHAVMTHADGSWARAVGAGIHPPTVHQSGPRRLWDALEEVRGYWLQHGELPVRGARVIVKPDGRTILARGNWTARLEAETPSEPQTPLP